ncbi:MAG: hypothetical protein ACI4B5_07410 [Bacteroidaceae bacterium]
MSGIWVPLGMFVVLPVSIVWIVFKYKRYATEKRTEVMLAAIEKNSGLDMEEFAKALQPERKTMREKLISRIHMETLFGVALTALGGLGMLFSLMALLYSIYMNMLKDGFFVMMLAFVPVLALGVGLLLGARQARKALTQLKD